MRTLLYMKIAVILDTAEFQIILSYGIVYLHKKFSLFSPIVLFISYENICSMFYINMQSYQIFRERISNTFHIYARDLNSYFPYSHTIHNDTTLSTTLRKATHARFIEKKITNINLIV